MAEAAQKSLKLSVGLAPQAVHTTSFRRPWDRTIQFTDQSVDGVDARLTAEESLVPRSTTDRSEARARLREQIELLETGCRNYDDGLQVAALNLATTIRVLVHDTKHSTSLLAQLGRKHAMQWCDDSSGLMPGNLLPESTMTMGKVVAEAGGSTVPRLAGGPGERRWLGFEDWWRRPAIRHPARSIHEDDTVLSAKDVVLGLTNKLGGAHVDPGGGTEELQMAVGNALGWMAVSGQTETPFAGSVLHASARHISHELLVTLNDGENRRLIEEP